MSGISLALRRVLVCSFVYSICSFFFFFRFRALMISVNLFSVLNETEELKLQIISRVAKSFIVCRYIAILAAKY